MAFESTSFENTAFLINAATLSLAATEAADTASVALAARHTLSLAATEANDTASIALSATHSASLAATEGSDSAAMALSAAHTASLAATESADTAFIIAGDFAALSFALTEAPDTAAVTATVLDGLSASLAATESADLAAFGIDVASLRRGGGSGKRVRYLVYRNDAVVEEDAPKRPKRLKRRKVSPELAREVDRLLPRVMGYTPEIVQAVLPETLYLPGALVGEGDNIAKALAAYIERLDHEDEDDIELLLLAA